MKGLATSVGSSVENNQDGGSGRLGTVLAYRRADGNLVQMPAGGAGGRASGGSGSLAHDHDCLMLSAADEGLEVGMGTELSESVLAQVGTEQS